MNASIVYLRSAVVGAVLVIVCATAAIAQTYQGALRGAVRDMQGLIPGAEVTLIPDEVCEIAVKQYDPSKSGDKDWPACIRLANRLDPSYAE